MKDQKVFMISADNPMFTKSMIIISSDIEKAVKKAREVWKKEDSPCDVAAIKDIGKVDFFLK